MPACARASASAGPVRRRRRGHKLCARAQDPPERPPQRAVEAFEDVLTTLGWAQDTDKIVFAHTHQPLDGVTGPSGRWRYWNTGSWIYEPDLSSKRAYAAYVRNAWPGTAVLIDTDEPHPRLLRLLEHPSSSNGPPGDANPEPLAAL